jgi:hypothetical protein
VPNFLSHWFLADPRRLCVLGVWLYLVGIATLFLSLIDGMALPGLTGGFLLAWCGGWAKETGREKFRRHRLGALRFPAEADEPATIAHPID